MAQQRSPDRRLVYLHCSSIFSGANAQVRKAKKITQLLQKHKGAIKILTKEFSLPAVAAVAKELLEDGIFESLPRAKLRYPELFQPSETQEAERAASEVEVIRIEAEAIQDVVLTSDNEGGDESPNFEQGEPKTKPDGVSDDEAKAGDNIQTNAVGQWQPTHDIQRTPRAHKILVLVQSLLEECCLDFGNTWVPNLMEARKWKEAESIELTQWIKRFSKHAKSLPLSAFDRVPGKSITEVLFGTSNLRHSAVHRLPTSAAGILNMLSAAIDFAEALKDSKRAERVFKIRTQLEASVQEVVQHQNLLECKLTAQFEDIARRRAELDELERSSIEEMLETDEKQRTEVGSAFEGFLGFQQISNSCACSHTANFDVTKTVFKAEENSSSSSWRAHEAEPSASINEALANDQSPPSEEEPAQAESPDDYARPRSHDDFCGSLEERAKISELDSPGFSSKEREKKGKKAATYGWAIPVPEEAPSLVDEASASADASPAPIHDTHKIDRGWHPYKAPTFFAIGGVAAEPYSAPDATVPAEEPCFPAEEPCVIAEEPCFDVPVEVNPRDEPCIIAPEEEPLPEDVSLGEGASCEEDLMGTENAALVATLKIPEVEPISESIDKAEEDTVTEHHKAAHDSDEPCEPPPQPDIASINGTPAENIELLVHRPRRRVWARRDTCASSSPPPTLPSPTIISVLEDAAPEPPTSDSHTITLKIVNGSKVFRTIISVQDCTRTAILKEARAYCVRRAESNQTFGKSLPKKWELALVSLKMYGYNTDLSTYKEENLSSLVRTVEKTGIPRFTLHISEV
ncbi:MAG: hypothetical protein L6R35_002444 [Caloplaca aegaea]|nr:MAG: hypothetical protein L6R35_002444 [Caloplaca aegaea]